MTNKTAYIKWVNDILVNDKKVYYIYNFENDSFECDEFENIKIKDETAVTEKQSSQKVVPVSFENVDDMKISYDKAAVKKKRGKKPSKMDRVFFLITQSILMAILFFTIGMLMISVI